MTSPCGRLLGLDLAAPDYSTMSRRDTHLLPHWQLAGSAILLGHKKIKSTVRYLGIEVDDALAIAEQVDV
jgi:hypothetical protein